MHNQDEAQMSSQYSSADDVIVQFGFLSAFFTLVTLLLTLIFFLWHIMMFFVLLIVPISTFSTLIFGCIVLVKAQQGGVGFFYLSYRNYTIHQARTHVE